MRVKVASKFLKLKKKLLFLVRSHNLNVWKCDVTLTLKPDHQRNLELQFSARLGDAVCDNSAVDNPSEDVHQDGLYLQTEKKSV